MKEVIRYQANDGSMFEDREACEHYDHPCLKITRVMARLPEVTVEGEGFVQLDKAAVLGVQRDLVLFFETHHWTDRHTEWARTADRPAGMHLIGRYVSDCGIGPERSAWSRLARIDCEFREYEQPYYAIQADKSRSSRLGAGE